MKTPLRNMLPTGFPKAVLTEEEKREILTALHSINSTSNIDNSQILQKLSAIFNVGSESWLEVDFSRWGNNGTDNAKFELLKSAVIQQRCVKITYANSYGTISERIIQPLKVLYKSMSWYLKAYCTEKQDYRIFKLTRIITLEMLSDTFDKKSFPELDEMSGQVYSTIVLRFTDSNLNHTGIYLYSKGKIMIHLTFDYQSDEGCTTPGQYLRYHRTFQGLTTRELAEKVGVVPATLVLYENDRHPIKHSTAVALANVLGIDRSRLLDEYTVFVDYPYSSLLKKVRRELSFTQMQMAEVIGIGQTTYSGWEREVRVPRRKEHEKILAAMKKLKVDVDTYLCQPNPL